MTWWRKRKPEPVKERRLPENGERRSQFEITSAETERRLLEVERRVDRLDPRISKLEAMADVLYRRHVEAD